ncbi:aldose 1-epimerase family protein [Corallibacter vietnamensis]|uniref:Aldose 1-epimerase family protein n=1 Tax=Corallibacter vietnamensis TaxID=904130 RepID=A0ABP7HD26_9FLAO
MYTLENSLLQITINPTGSELQRITSVKHNTQFMWDGNPDIWSGFAPILFPIVGGLKQDTYYFNDKAYKLPRHGFYRRNKDIKLYKQGADSLTFKLESNDELYQIYPFVFEFYTTYQLKEHHILITHKVKNVDTKTMYFSLGEHPAFKCPVFDGETYEDYILEFEHSETSKTHLLDNSGLLNLETQAILENSKTLQLHKQMFNNDALIFKDLASKSVTLTSKNKGPILTVNFQDFPYLGLWAKPQANYICIEPWLGIADNIDSNQNITEKEGIIKLAPNNEFQASYGIEINKKHLE